MTSKELNQWKEVYERQFNTVFQVAYLYLKNQADAEDAVQGVFLKQMEKKKFFEDEKQERAWFISVTRNYCKDVLRSFWRKNISLGEPPEIQTENYEEQELIHRILQLPVKYSEVLYLYYYEERSIREIAKILKRKESTIGSRLANARKLLKQKIEQEGI